MECIEIVHFCIVLGPFSGSRHQVGGWRSLHGRDLAAVIKSGVSYRSLPDDLNVGSPRTTAWHADDGGQGSPAFGSEQNCWFPNRGHLTFIRVVFYILRLHKAKAWWSFSTDLNGKPPWKTMSSPFSGVVCACASGPLSPIHSPTLQCKCGHAIPCVCKQLH